MTIFFTADQHFGHANIIKYCNRPFSDVNNMNDMLMMYWNSVVGKDDLVYHLGDFAMKSAGEYAKQLNGRKILIIGSHDKLNYEDKKQFEEIIPLKIIKHEGVPITLCHYCMRTWYHSHFNAWHLFGHSHGRLEPIGKSWDVGVDNNNFYPINMNWVCEMMKGASDNFNMVKEHE